MYFMTVVFLKGLLIILAVLEIWMALTPSQSDHSSNEAVISFSKSMVYCRPAIAIVLLVAAIALTPVYGLITAVILTAVLAHLIVYGSMAISFASAKDMTAAVIAVSFGLAQLFAYAVVCVLVMSM